MACWLAPLSSCCTSMLLVVEGVSGEGSCRLYNGELGSTSTGCSGVAEF